MAIQIHEPNQDKLMKKVKESPFFAPLLDRYFRSPSIALCRVPELELFSRIELQHPVLDHCCGDGYIASKAFPDTTLEAGIDISDKRLQAAQQTGVYRSLHKCDANQPLPFSDGQFSTVINNSGIEHIPDLHTAISEISRVLCPGGKLYMNVLNTRYFEYWPLPPETAEDYKTFQPFYHALDEVGWQTLLENNGFRDVKFVDYFPKESSRVLARLDYYYSSHFLRKKISPLLLLEALLPKQLLKQRWKKNLGELSWEADAGSGGGFLIQATKASTR